MGCCITVGAILNSEGERRAGNDLSFQTENFSFVRLKTLFFHATYALGVRQMHSAVGVMPRDNLEPMLASLRVEAPGDERAHDQCAHHRLAHRIARQSR